LSNWDLKTSNNKLYMVTNEDGIKDRRYVVAIWAPRSAKRASLGL
jgi:hypothetical protein